ncbi:MAG TPA: SRPBCC family protein [Micromonospora sp.]
MRFTTGHVISAPVERVWAALIDVESWPEWTASVRRVQRLDDGPFQVGSTARIEQPRLRPAVWRVTLLTPPDQAHPEAPARFDWVSRAGGVTTVAGHLLVPSGNGRVRVEHSIDQAGPLAPLVALLGGSLIRRYVQTEADGLKAHCERG